MRTLKSRKLWAMIAAVLGSVAAALAGEVTWAQALMAAAGVVVVYLGGQSYVDGQTASAGIEVGDVSVAPTKDGTGVIISAPLPDGTGASIVLADGEKPKAKVDGHGLEEIQLPKDLLPGGKLWGLVSRLKIKFGDSTRA
jgi:hypothetical protein